MNRYDTQRLGRPGAAASLRLLLTLAAALMLGGMVAGCGDGGTATGEAETGLSAAQFVEVVTALRQAEREVEREVEREDSAVVLFAQRKAEILAEHAVTEEELRTFLVRNQEDPALLQAAWDSISQRLKYVPGPVDEDADDDYPDLEPRPGDRLDPPQVPSVRRPDDDQSDLRRERPRPPGEQRLH